MKENLLYWVWLTNIKGIGPITSKILLKKFRDPEKIYEADEKELISITGIGKSTVKLITGSKDLSKVSDIIEKCNKENIKILTYCSNSYPLYAKNYDKIPIILYYKGKIHSDSIGIAVVGSRRCTDYGKKIAIEVGEALAQNNIIVISGMAKGIDSYAHTACINAGGQTIAVLGCGVDICYPKEHIKLMEKIIESGAVISEYPPGTLPEAKHFPKRNSLISAFSKKILIVEATESSGALITGKYGLEMNREVLAVPSSIYSPTSKGCNKLIYEGAKIYMDTNQLLNGMKNYVDIKDNCEKFDELEQKIIDIIKEKPRKIDEIILLSNTNISKITTSLFSLELRDIVYVSGGIYHIQGLR